MFEQLPHFPLKLTHTKYYQYTKYSNKTISVSLPLKLMQKHFSYPDKELEVLNNTDYSSEFLQKTGKPQWHTQRWDKN